MGASWPKAGLHGRGVTRALQHRVVGRVDEVRREVGRLTSSSGVTAAFAPTSRAS